MRKKGMILATLILLLTFPFTAGADSMYWDFSSGLDTTMFMVDQMGTGFTLDDSGGNLLFSKTLTGNLGACAVDSKFYLVGNFSIQVDYNLVSSINSGDMIFFGFGSDTPDVWYNIARADYQPYPGNVYDVYPITNEPTTDTYGTFHWQRTGSSVSASVIHDGTETSICTFDFGTQDVRCWVGVTQNGGDYGQLAVSFDNLYVTADDIVPLPGAVWLLGSGLLGLVGLRRFRKG